MPTMFPRTLPEAKTEELSIEVYAALRFQHPDN